MDILIYNGKVYKIFEIQFPDWILYGQPRYPILSAPYPMDEKEPMAYQYKALRFDGKFFGFEMIDKDKFLNHKNKKMDNTNPEKAQNPINRFAAEVANSEGGKSQSSVGDIAQAFKIANKVLGGNAFYALIRNHYAPPIEDDDDFPNIVAGPADENTGGRV